jgi:integrase
MKSLTYSALDALLAVTEQYSTLDALAIRTCFNHALRVSELLALTKANVVSGHLIVCRLKGSRKTSQPLLDDERAALETLAASTEGRLFPMSRVTFWRKMQRYGAEAGIAQHTAHPHALRHSAGRLGYLGGMGIPELQRYFGHVSGSNTLIYMESSEAEACSAFAAALGAQSAAGAVA